ncbi:MAG TPA: glycosyl hydrolase [Solirubrobacteraceae bacterium]|nr:glycosyl hydrolase [Solirubrobacteraceae bacterium]
MHLRPIRVSLACLLALALAPAAAHAAKPVIGYGDQRPEMFSDPLFSQLAIRDSRIVVEWDTFQFKTKTAELDAWMAAAKAAGSRPLVAIEHSWTPGRMKLAPSPGQYATLVRKLRARYPFVRAYSPWNEANHASQPTARTPKLAATYWKLMRRACAGCQVTSPVYLDLKGATSRRWLAAFKKATGNRVRLWAIHGYGDLNRGSDKSLAALVRTLPGTLWVTEAAGFVAFGGGWKYNEARAARAITYTFKLVRKYRAKITRWYFYQWRGVPKGARWDSGVVGVSGTPRPGYAALKRGLAATR